ncbi:MAG: chromosome segregation protein SMC [Pseudomonadales bacterium]|nr:chromosome segregation protein SMC [Pseudomonadales bacterium]
MRLQAIKLAGFKSFVDPTTVPFPSNLCAVVGPNGCGKSNIIDAVRWVMGESSAKTLRGESMADVIFNGSVSRKPIGQATIELLFDNVEGRLTGEYAAYSEISIKRQVTRDGQSSYFLNGVKCRRKDITDIFLGTGLGPRSYSIIEQGMISQLIEAKPEDLRSYLEEAAGISKYKERRRETERRIRHTKDNLNRLSDLRDELERNLHHLERQAKAAERYKEYRKEERGVKAELQALRWQAITGEAKAKEENIQRLTNEQEARVADQRHVDAEIEQQRDGLSDLSEQLNDVQRQYYDFGTEIARIEDGIQYQNERVGQLLKDLEELEASRAKVKTDLASDTQLIARLTAELAQTEFEQRRFQELEESSGNSLLTVEQSMQKWQHTWDEFNQVAAESRQQSEVQQSRIKHLEQAIERQNNRLRSLTADIERLQGLTDEQEIAPLEAMQSTQQEQLSRIEVELATLTETIEQQREENTRVSELLNSKRGNLQLVLGRQASLEALQQAALGQQDDAEVAWLTTHDMADNPRLAEQLKVEDDWVLAVETVLGDSLQAVCVSGLDAVGELLGDLASGSIKFITTGTSVAATADRLASKVTGDVDVTGLLHGVYTADSLSAALAMRSNLKEGESVVTSDGIWMGANWLRVSKSTDSEASVIRRQTELDALSEQIENLQQEVAQYSSELESNVAALSQADSDRDQQQSRMAEQQRAFSETRAQLGAKRVQAEQVKADIARASEEVQACNDELAQDRTLLSDARHELQRAMDSMEQDTIRRTALTQERDSIQSQLDEARSTAKVNRESAHALALKIQSLQAQINSAEHASTRLKEQEQSLEERRVSIEQAIKESQGPQDNLKKELEEFLAKRLKVEGELAQVRQNSEALEFKIRELEQQRSDLDEQIETVRTSLEEVRLDYQSLDVRRATIQEQMAEDKADLGEVIAALSEEANEEEWEDKLRRVGNRIQRLGNPNLAAIDDFKVQSERKEYLDAQNEDLEKALTTLENAIRKIDVETRTRFKETFDAVNSKLQTLFPKLFGGGHAYLEMTGEDLLDTGVGLMARPPGKRNSSIHLLSGGEKALTAIALVFSIFSLNPAPFCLLDEVDAPLDDTNVGRYSDLVKEMSRTVQFIYITHNKIAMEMGEQLMGVTMHEPGVSRLVSVDVEEAVAMAAV